MTVLPIINNVPYAAVAAKATKWAGVSAVSDNNVGVYGKGSMGGSFVGADTGVYGSAESANGIGVVGYNANGMGVMGIGEAPVTAYIEWFDSNGNFQFGENEISETAKGVYGKSKLGVGVFGSSETGIGVFGKSNSDANAAIVAINSSGGDAVYAQSKSGAAITASSESGPAIAIKQGNIEISKSDKIVTDAYYQAGTSNPYHEPTPVTINNIVGSVKNSNSTNYSDYSTWITVRNKYVKATSYIFVTSQNDTTVANVNSSGPRGVKDVMDGQFKIFVRADDKVAFWVIN